MFSPIEMVTANDGSSKALFDVYPNFKGSHGHHHGHQNGHLPVKHPKHGPHTGGNPPPVTKPPAGDEKPQTDEVVKRTLDCVYPKPPTIPRLRDPIPMPQDISEAISWVYAYVGRMSDLALKGTLVR
jgi:hypothetical protein